MKYLLIGCVISLLVISACKEKDPEPTANLNNLLGIWQSVDSNLIKNNVGEYVYMRDTLTISSDTLTNELGEKTSPFLKRKGSRFAYYEMSYFGADSLVVNYFGPNKERFLTRHHVVYNTNMDTIQIENFKNIYPTNTFERYLKMK